MSLLALVGIALVMSLDSLTAALALGAAAWRRRALPIALSFGVLGGLAPLAGLWLGERISARLTDLAAWLGVGLLLAIGLYFIASALRARSPAFEKTSSALKAGKVLALAFSLSIDNLLISFGLGLRGAAPYTLAAISAFTIFTLSYLGLLVGDAARQAWHHWAGVGAGVALMGLALLLVPRG